MTLKQLKTAQKGKIIRINGSGSIRQRLLSLGFRSEEIVQMIKLAPLKDPLEISLGSEHLSIRRKEADLIIVELLSE